MIGPSQEYRRIAVRRPPKLHGGLDAAAYQIMGARRRGVGHFLELHALAQAVDALSPGLRTQADHRLRETIQECAALYRRRRENDEVLVRALAAIREVTARQTGLYPYLVQVVGALALHRNYLAEMATGEGKTLTAAMAAVLAGMSGRPCHIVTVNDYLAQRDADWFRNLYRFCGVSVGFVTSEMEPARRRTQYASDVTYTTSKEIVADFLRDRLALGLLQQPARRLIREMLNPAFSVSRGLVMRGLHTAIIDEADSVLIDEAVTPLIICHPRGNASLRDACRIAHEVAQTLQEGRDYRVDMKYKEVRLFPESHPRIEAACGGLSGLWKGPQRRQELIEQVLTARELFHAGRQYVVQDGKVVIVDEFTGRLMPQRTWREGLHQAIEAKEGLEISEPTETLARLSFQRFFRLFERLSGMTGTAREAAPEFWQIYALPVMAIPTHRPCILKLMPDRMFSAAEAKWNAIVEDIVRIHDEGRPLLVGTRSVAASELLAGRLAALGLSYNLLNATRHREEAQIVAEAGQADRITIATNMAGRGTDIKLGRGVAEKGGLHVIATERHESQRIDRQLFGRAGRQGDPGSAQAYVSLEDELIVRFVPSFVRKRLQGLLQSGHGKAYALSEAATIYAVRTAQRMAFRQRRSVLKTDTWLDEALSFAGPDAVK